MSDDKDKAPEPCAALKRKQVEALKKEIESMRGWLNYLEKDIEGVSGVIHVILLNSISESCTKIIYQSGIYNGAGLLESEVVAKGVNTSE